MSEQQYAFRVQTTDGAFVQAFHAVVNAGSLSEAEAKARRVAKCWFPGRKSGLQNGWFFFEEDPGYSVRVAPGSIEETTAEEMLQRLLIQI